MRKTRVTKKEIIAIREQKKNYNSYKSKQVIIPGPWTNIGVKFKVETALRPHKSVLNSFSEFYGCYSDELGWPEKGWYPVVFNININNLKHLVEKNGFDLVIAAAERALNEILDTDGKQAYGSLVILRAGLHIANEEHFITCRGKTNKKSIKGFLAVRSNKCLIL